MGLRRQLPQLTTPRGSSATLAQPLQHQQAAQRAPGPTTDQPRSEPLWARHLESGLVDLPELAVDAPGPDDVLRALERGDAAESALAVDEQRPLPAVRRELELGARDSGELDDLDPPARDRPQRVLAANRFGAVGRVELALERLRERRQQLGALLEDEVAAR